MDVWGARVGRCGVRVVLLHGYGSAINPSFVSLAVVHFIHFLIFEPSGSPAPVTYLETRVAPDVTLPMGKASIAFPKFIEVDLLLVNLFPLLVDLFSCTWGIFSHERGISMTQAYRSLGMREVPQAFDTAQGCDSAGKAANVGVRRGIGILKGCCYVSFLIDHSSSLEPSINRPSTKA